MGEPKYKVKYPELNGAEQHHDLKNNPGEQGDPNHTKDSAKSDTSDKQDDDK